MTDLHTFLCLVLAWTCFCRIVKTGRETLPSIRLSFAWGVTTSLLLAAAPWLHLAWAWWPRYEPHPAVMAVLGCVVWWQWATAKYWKKGPPRHFKREG
jgi:hypothetical protein